MNLLFERLLSNGPIVTDGAWGTQLQARGLAFGECPDAWNLTHPELVSQVAQGYAAAGSSVILTNTFGASRIALARHGLAESASEINRKGAAISRDAASTTASVFGSIGPTGKMLAMGEVSEQEAREAFMEQAAALADGGADALVVETMSDLDEARIALLASKETGLPVVACMTYGAGRDADRTIMGVTPERAAEQFIAAGADAVGANCGQGASQMLPICVRLMAACGGTPVWIKPNAGLPEIVDGRAVYNTSPLDFAASAVALVEAGASFIGGCCGTSPEYIMALRAAFGVGRWDGKSLTR